MKNHEVRYLYRKEYSSLGGFGWFRDSSGRGTIRRVPTEKNPEPFLIPFDKIDDSEVFVWNVSCKITIFGT